MPRAFGGQPVDRDEGQAGPAVEALGGGLGERHATVGEDGLEALVDAAGLCAEADGVRAAAVDRQPEVPPVLG